ncbi:MAG: hypothetical protein ACI4OA_04610 [Selenomonadaceae bacterium]
MADVDEETLTLKKHVRAAREWLGEAEESIEGDDTIRGDLSLMLAQAELTHAKEKAELSPRRRWASRLMPLSLAVVIAFFIWSAWPLSRGFAPAATSQGGATSSVTETSAEARGHSEASADADGGNVSYVMDNRNDAAIEVRNISEATADEAIKENIIESSSEIIENINEDTAKENFGDTIDKMETRKVDAANVESVPVAESEVSGVPTVEMQKLMSAAAEHLRAQ